MSEAQITVTMPDREERTFHVTPESDEPEHAVNGFCWCMPTYEDVGLDGRIYIHRRTLDSPSRERAS